MFDTVTGRYHQLVLHEYEAGICASSSTQARKKARKKEQKFKVLKKCKN